MAGGAAMNRIQSMQSKKLATLLAVLGLGLGLAACGDDDPAPPAPTVAMAEVIRGGFSLTRGERVTPVVAPARVEEETTVASGPGGRGSLRMDSGAWVLFDRDSRAVVRLDGLTLEGGRLWIDAARAEETRVDTGHGTVAAIGATFAVSIEGDEAHVYCGSGEVTYQSDDGEGRLAQGETLVLGAGDPQVEAAELWDDWTGGLSDPSPEPPRGPSYVGVLRGRRIDQLGQARTPLPIRAHEVDAAIRGDLVETTVVQTFFNARSDSLEAEYGVRIPAGAIVTEFSVDQGGGFIPAVVAPMATNSGYELSWAPAATATSRLTWDGPERLRARINPVTPGATIRVSLKYTEWLERRGDIRTWVYPMERGADAPQIGEFVLEVNASGSHAKAYRAGMGAVTTGGQVVLRRSDFRPTSDFYLDLVDEGPPDGEVARAYVTSVSAGDMPEGDEKYVLIDLPTAGLAAGDEESTADHPLELVLVVDASGATDDEDLELSRAIVESVLRQLAPTDRVTLRLGDVRARVPEGVSAEPTEASDETREAILEGLAHADLGGATDLGAMLRDAARVVAGRPRGAVLYLGDGVPTTGYLDATAISQALSSVHAPPRFFAFGVGDGANIDLLRALFQEQAQAVGERTVAARAVMGVLAAAARPTLRGVTVALGEGIERVYPRPPITARDGAHIRLVGRLVGDLPAEVTLRGTRDGEAVEATYRVEKRDIVDGGDVRKRWATGRLRQLMDADAGREALVELGVRFSLLSPWTSLVVGGRFGDSYLPVQGFDHDPVSQAWFLAGGAPGMSVEHLDGGAGWRRRARRPATASATAPERTWVTRVSTGDDEAAPRGTGTGGAGRGSDGGLSQASVARALALGTRGPRGCYERKLTVRPDLAGDVRVTVSVDGDGRVDEARIVSSSLSAVDVDACILTEVRGIRYPATGASGKVEVSHVYSFAMANRAFGQRRQCSDASRQGLDTRQRLWRERLAASGGVPGALHVYREASSSCEVGSWRARRTLLRMMLRGVGGIEAQVRLYRAFGRESPVAAYLRRAILRNVRTPHDVEIVRAGLGIDAPVDWGVFSRLYKANTSPEARLRLVRTWLEVIPEEMDLRLRLLALLEETAKIPEARRLARDLRGAPLADARVRTAVGEFWLRQDDIDEARRVFSEIVETAPLDPWARKRLGDLYRTHGWYDDAYREYQTLARLRPNDDSVLLDLARAAAGAERLDEALRLEQRLSETADAGAKEGIAELARLWTRSTAVRGAGLRRGARRRPPPGRGRGEPSRRWGADGRG
ncbi:MAG: hypothetical protein DRJ42_00720, partial [Deltaproteobacteria bacterium]